MSKFGGRKFVGFVIILLVGILVDAGTKEGMSTNMLSLLLGLYAAFALGNVTDTLAVIRGVPKGAAPQAATADLDSKLREVATYLDQQIAARDARLEEISQGIRLQNEAVSVLLQRAGSGAAPATNQATVNRAAAQRVYQAE